MRNWLRVLAFDIAAPVAAIVALVFVGVVLAWPLWWVSACSVLCLLIIQGVVVNVVLAGRDGVTVGTDDDRPGLRLGVVAVSTAALLAAVVVGYVRWTAPDRTFDSDRAEVVDIASAVSEATATFAPQDPNAAVDRAARLMTPQRAQRFKNEFAGVVKELTSSKVSGQASTISAGVEALGAQAASVAVVLHSTRNAPGKPVDTTVLALRVTLSKTEGHWLVEDVTQLHSR